MPGLLITGSEDSHIHFLYNAPCSQKTHQESEDEACDGNAFHRRRGNRHRPVRRRHNAAQHKADDHIGSDISGDTAVHRLEHAHLGQRISDGFQDGLHPFIRPFHDLRSCPIRLYVTEYAILCDPDAQHRGVNQLVNHPWQKSHTLQPKKPQDDRVHTSRQHPEGCGENHAQRPCVLGKPLYEAIYRYLRGHLPCKAQLQQTGIHHPQVDGRGNDGANQ